MIDKKEMIANYLVATIIELASARLMMQNYITALVETPECLIYRIPQEYHTLADLVGCVVSIIDNDNDVFSITQRIILIDAILPLVNEIGILGISLKHKRESLIKRR